MEHSPFAKLLDECGCRQVHADHVVVHVGGKELTVHNGGIVVDELRGIVTITGAALPAEQGQALRISAPVEFARAKWRPPRDRAAPYFRRGRWE